MEFFIVQDFLKEQSKFLKKTIKNNSSMSCEMIAEHFVEALREYCNQERSIKVEVTEDGQNGSIVSYEARE